ncbi:IQ domain-containing protein K isoform X3 [Lemur catta]|uniref:IQ domain-containing protein K isoform X3 n=1 Tax=Lemur catta TaxID=9447 RepID=UPI001E266F3E|nr:IQ domain-containing protein K isoform X3 [Lemur catta]
MAAPPRISSRTAQREEPSWSATSSITRTSVRTASSGSPELTVLPGQVAEPPGKSLWEQICEEYEDEQPPFPEGYKGKQEAVMTVSPLEEMLSHGFSTEHCFPVPHFPVTSYKPCPEEKVETVDPKTCSPKEYLETFIFPILLPGMASLLHQAKKEKCFEPTSCGELLSTAPGTWDTLPWEHLTISIRFSLLGSWYVRLPREKRRRGDAQRREQSLKSHKIADLEGRERRRIC